jgi:chemotaxis regulatin CheY-phosphate phosphatase CheZ
MTEYTPEEIVEMADKLMKDIADSTKDIASEESEGAVDVTMAANYADRCAQLIKNLAESVSELHQRVDVLTEKE